MNLKCRTAVLVLTLGALRMWAGVLGAPGVPNFHQVDAQIYRGGQPSDEGWHSLAKLGIKTVVDLRRPNEHSTSAEQQAVKAAGMSYLNVPMNGLFAPTDAIVSKLLRIFDTKSAGPIFVHCRRGADRTGTVVACYRMSHDHWQNERALSEAKSFGMSWVEIGMRRYISRYRPATDQADSGQGSSSSAERVAAIAP